MKKSITLLAGASMLFLGVPSVVFAQGGAASGPFADVPADHWAYQSVDNLQKAGIVIGYPDGTYGGKRAMTRYEFAVAIARLLPLINGNSNYATKDDLAAAQKDLEDKLAANQGAIDDLTKLVDEFQPELEKLGQDVAAIKDRLDALEARVAAVEEEQRRVKITGALNIIGRADANTKSGTGGFYDENGQPIVNQSYVDGTPMSPGSAKKLLAASDVYNDFVLGIRGKLSDTATANVKLDFGNYLTSIGNTATAPGGVEPGSLTSAAQTTTVWEAYLDAPVSLGPLGGAELVAGRFGNQWTKYTLKQIDSDVYTYLYQTDSGNVTTDGAKVSLKLGPAKIQAFAGKNDDIPFDQPFGGAAYAGTPGRRPLGTIADNAAVLLTQGAGVRATFGAPEGAILGLTVEQFGTGGPTTDPNRLATPGVTSQYDRLSVYGADFNGAVPFFKKSGLGLDLNYTVSGEGNDEGFNNVGSGWRYTSTDDQLGFVIANIAIKGGYQYIGPEFSAPGAWGKLGAWDNPTNVKGGVVSAKYSFTPKLGLDADYEGYKTAYGTTIEGNDINSPLQQGDALNRYQVGLNYGLTKSYDVDLGYESIQYDLRNNNGTLPGTPSNPTGVGKPIETYVNIGIGHTINTNTSFKFLYQIVNYDDKGTGFDPNANGGKEQGGVAVGQLSLKF
jgi:hypothetical protein